MLELGLIVSRFIHYLALLTLFGVSFFPWYIYRRHTEPLQLARWRWIVLLTGAIVALLSGILLLMCTVANMVGIPAAMFDANTVWSVLHDTEFGNVWMVHLALSAAVMLVIACGRDRLWNNYMPVFYGLLLVSLAGVGHTHQEDWVAELVHVTTDAVHLLAAGAWLGGLFVLLYILLPRHSRPPENRGVQEILSRFSVMGYVAVAVLIASGVINSWFLVGSFAALLGTLYGRLLLVKLSLFFGMLGLAAANRLWLVPALTRKKDQQSVLLLRLRHHVLAEEIAGILIAAVVSVLGIIEPAVG